MKKFRLDKMRSWQYKREIPAYCDETFHVIKSQDIISEEFTTLSGSRQDRTEFHLDQPGSCNQHLTRKNTSESTMTFQTAKLFGNWVKSKTLNKPKTKFHIGNLHRTSKTLTRFWRKSVGLSHTWVQLLHPWCRTFTSVRKTIPHCISI